MLRPVMSDAFPSRISRGRRRGAIGGDGVRGGGGGRLQPTHILTSTHLRCDLHTPEKDSKVLNRLSSAERTVLTINQQMRECLDQIYADARRNPMIADLTVHCS